MWGCSLLKYVTLSMLEEHRRVECTPREEEKQGSYNESLLLEDQ